MKPKIKHVNWLPFNLRGCCFPPFGIFVNRGYFNKKYPEVYKRPPNEVCLAKLEKCQEEFSKVEEHELIHYSQYKRMGLIMYYFRYLMQLILIGYDTMPMEMEARQNEAEYVKWNYRETYHKKK